MLRGTTLLELDLDGCTGFSRKSIKRRLSKAGVPMLRIQARPSPGQKGFHVAVEIRGRFNPAAQIALQAILESDPDREAQNFRRALLADPKWKENWQVLYE
jgi:hypothetical protein